MLNKKWNMLKSQQRNVFKREIVKSRENQKKLNKANKSRSRKRIQKNQGKELQKLREIDLMVEKR